MFKLLWPSHYSRHTINIPRYLSGEEEDSIDLQIRSLIYMFKRYNIHKFSPFLKSTEVGSFEFDYVQHAIVEEEQWGVPDSGIINDKLDQVYDIKLFERILLDDPYRILIDYTKNKFRSMLILSDFPKETSKLPSFNVSNFQFIILKADSTNDEYIDAIVNNSGIYNEHKVSTSVKTDILTNILNLIRKSEKKLTKSDRSNIIQSYVQKLAFNIQVDRIFKATMRSREKDISIVRTRDSLSLKQESTSQRKPLRSQRSKINIMAGAYSNQEDFLKLKPASPSPIKQLPITSDEDSSPSKRLAHRASKKSLRNKPSMSILKLDRIYNNTTDISNSTISSNNGESDNFIADSTLSTFQADHSISANSGVSIYTSFTTEERTSMFEQSKMAVRIRVEREKSFLTKGITV